MIFRVSREVQSTLIFKFELKSNSHCVLTYRANTTVAGDYLVSQTDAAGVVATSPPPAPDTPIDPIGRWDYLVLLMIIVFSFSFSGQVALCAVKNLTILNCCLNQILN